MIRVLFDPRPFVAFLVLIIASCAPHNVAQFGAGSPLATQKRIFVATELELDNLGPIFGQERPSGLKFMHLDVSVPPTHTPGNIEWPNGEPDAATDFVMTGSQVYPTAAQMVGAMRRGASDRETLVYVHGYNVTFSDAVYRFAQIRTDFGLIDEGLVYSWPSAGDVRGYAYDRDSVLYSRDDFEAVLNALTVQSGGRVHILGHSMGSQLVMETLRQAALRGNRAMLNRISSVTLMSPDIDPDVFRQQAKAIGTLPDPFLIFVSQQDRALNLSSLLTGFKPRLGVIDGPDQVEGLGVSVLDFTGLSDGRALDHSVPVTSPLAIKVLRGMIEQAEGGAPDFRDYMMLTQPQ
ncbi:MAG: alpha/beta fold hydrolase [Pseudomonadota bacterium]